MNSDCGFTVTRSGNSLCSSPETRVPVMKATEYLRDHKHEGRMAQSSSEAGELSLLSPHVEASAATQVIPPAL